MRRIQKLWLDDARAPFDDSWIWVRTCAGAKDVLANNEVAEASLDHDLGYEGEVGGESIFIAGNALEDGTSLVKWMIQNGNCPQVVLIHSWNDIAARRMHADLTEAFPSCVIALRRFTPNRPDAK